MVPITELDQELCRIKVHNFQSFSTLTLGRNLFVAMQSTGLLDVHKKEVFEGDIVKNPWMMGIVVWLKEGWMVKHIPPAEGYWRLSDIIEILGNIYENPDLIPG